MEMKLRPGAKFELTQTAPASLLAVLLAVSAALRTEAISRLRNRFENGKQNTG
jgi:hypothetical protein